MDIFDILGPVMVGPSSSHTAGAARIGAMARTLLGEPVTEAKIHLYGSFAETGRGHGTDRALVAGLLGMNIDLPFGMGVHGDGAAWEFWVILILSVALTAVSSFLLAKMTDSVKIRTPKQVKRKRRRD